MSFKPAIQTVNDDKYYHNNLAFATPEEAEASAKDVFSRWMLATSWRVDESDQPVNARLVGDKLELLTEATREG